MLLTSKRTIGWAHALDRSANLRGEPSGVQSGNNGHPTEKEVLDVSDFTDKAKELYAEAYEELATLEGVDAMDPLEPESTERTETDEAHEPPQ
ncbi:MAG: hypothetical protein ABI251_04530 [Mycobacteriaceae bacterium]